jgi:hypothetical protein
MAGRSQYPVESMETQSRFSLTNALATWRREFEAQPGITSDAVRELESHLIDSMNQLRQKGLNEEEAFWLARRRLGPCKEVAAEITKADPSGLWRERVFWMAAALLCGHLLLELSRVASIFVTPFVGTFILGTWFSSPDGYRWTQFLLLQGVTVGACVLALGVARGSFRRPFRLLPRLSMPRRRLAWVLCGLVGIEWWLSITSIHPLSAALVVDLFPYFPLWPGLVALLLLLLSERPATHESIPAEGR